MSSYNIRYVFEAVDKISGVMSKIDSNVKKSQQTFNAFKQVGTVMAAAGATGAAGLFKLTKESARFESSFAGVRKTVDASESGFAKLRKGILDMSTELPASANEIAGVAEAAGQLGIKEKDIMHFTKTMVMMGTATNMASDEAAMALARFANITQMPTKNVDRLSATVVALGNNLATTESEIVEMGLRLAGAGHQIGMTEAQIMSFAGALSSVGIQAEAGGSAFSRVMIEMANAVELGGDELKLFAKVAGMSAKDFQKAFREDASSAIITFIEGLGEMSESGENTFQVLDELGLSEIRVRDALLRAAGAGDLFRESMEIGSRAWKENTALTNEATERYKTFESQLDLTKNKLSKVAIIVGDELREAFADLLEKLQPVLDKVVELAEKFSELDQDTKTLIVTVSLLSVGFTLLAGPALLLIGFIPQIVKGFQMIMKVTKSLNKVLRLLRVTLTLLIGPWGLIAAAALAAVTLIIVYWEPIKEFFVDLWESIKDTGISIWEELSEAWGLAADTFSSIWEGVKEFFDLLWTGMLEVATGIWEDIITVWESVSNTFREIFSPMSEFFQDLTQTTADVATEVWESFATTLSTIWENIQEGASESWELIKNAILGPILLLIDIALGDFEGFGSDLAQIWINIEGSASTIWGSISSTVSSIVDLMVDTVINIVVGFSGSLSNLWSSIKETSANIWESLRGAVITVISNLVIGAMNLWNNLKIFVISLTANLATSVISKWNELKTRTAEIFNSIKDVITDPLTAINLFMVGVNIIQGLVRGIKSMYGAVKEAIANVAKTVQKGIRKALKIKSPSRVMIEIGEFTGEGLAKGIDAMVGDIEKASVDMAIAATPDIPPVEMSYTTPDSYESASLSSAGGTINAQNKDDLLANAIDKLERKLDGLVVEMDGQTVGRIVRPHVNDGNALDSTVRRYFD